MVSIPSANPKRAGKTIAMVVTAHMTANRFVHGFAMHLAQLGHTVTVIASDLEPKTVTTESGSITTCPIAIARNPKPIADLISLWRIRQELRRIRPDILTYATPKASLLSSIAGASLCIRVRTYQVWGLRLETTVGIQRVLLATAERLTSHLSTRLIANSPSLAQTYTHLRLNANRKIDIYGHGSSHGVDTTYYSSNADFPPLDAATSQFIKEAEYVIGFVGRLHPDKGIDTLLEALDICIHRGMPFSLLLVGNDEGAELHNRYASSAAVHATGTVEDPRPHYANMDVLVLPSRREGFPNVVLEAAAMGVPAIVSDATGARDSVVDGETGVLVPTDDPQRLAAALQFFAVRPDVRRDMGIAARRLVRAHFEQRDIWDLMSEGLLDQKI